jgi:hypothetical protein
MFRHLDEEDEGSSSSVGFLWRRFVLISISPWKCIQLRKLYHLLGVISLATGCSTPLCDSHFSYRYRLHSIHFLGLTVRYVRIRNTVANYAENVTIEVSRQCLIHVFFVSIESLIRIRANNRSYAIWNTTAGGDSLPATAGYGPGQYYPNHQPKDVFGENGISSFVSDGAQCGENTDVHVTLQDGMILKVALVSKLLGHSILPGYNSHWTIASCTLVVIVWWLLRREEVWLMLITGESNCLNIDHWNLFFEINFACKPLTSQHKIHFL